jgi:hypothetical protein
MATATTEWLVERIESQLERLGANRGSPKDFTVRPDDELPEGWVGVSQDDARGLCSPRHDDRASTCPTPGTTACSRSGPDREDEPGRAEQSAGSPADRFCSVFTTHVDRRTRDRSPIDPATARLRPSDAEGLLLRSFMTVPERPGRIPSRFARGDNTTGLPRCCADRAGSRRVPVLQSQGVTPPGTFHELAGPMPNRTHPRPFGPTKPRLPTAGRRPLRRTPDGVLRRRLGRLALGIPLAGPRGRGARGR